MCTLMRYAFQLIVEGMLGLLMPIFGIRLGQCANSFAIQIYVYDHDYLHCPPSPENDHNEIKPNNCLVEVPSNAESERFFF